MFGKLKEIKENARVMKDAIKAIVDDESARMTMHAGPFGKVIGLFIIALLVGTIFVVGIQELENANTTGLSTTEITLIGVVGLILIVAVLWVILQYVGLV